MKWILSIAALLLGLHLMAQGRKESIKQALDEHEKKANDKSRE